MKRILALTAALFLAGCDLPVDTIAGKIQTGVEKACQFRADYAWVTEVVVKMDVTAQMVDKVIGMICEGVTAAQSSAPLGLLSKEEPKCMWGEIIVNGEKVCIQGEPVEEGK